MTGQYDYDIVSRTHKIMVWNDAGTKCYEFTCIEHNVPESLCGRPTVIKKDQIGPWRGLAKAFQKMDLLSDDATKTELKATKYHLEDMRKLTFKEPLN